MAVVASADLGRRALERGATILQLRCPGADAALVAREARDLLAGTGVPVVVNGRVDIALALGIGVHLP
ncbi:MAG: thiamine phosphate synthase, partial [Candidatus Dormibacteraceae bacterium]